MKTKQTSYVCWRCTDGGRIKFNDLIERNESNGHYDYVCPKCEVVIICSNKRIKKEAGK